MRNGLSFLCSSLLWALVLAQPGVSEHVTNRATRTFGAGTPLRGARALNVTRQLFVLVHFFASAFFSIASKSYVRFIDVVLMWVIVVGLPIHAGASLFYNVLSLDFWRRPLASNFAGGAPLSGQPANMRRPIEASTKSVFVILVYALLQGFMLKWHSVVGVLCCIRLFVYLRL